MNLLISKSKRILEVKEGAQVLRSINVALGSAPVGTKHVEGDGRTPEGEYAIVVKNPESRFHLSLGLSYPNLVDGQAGLEAGLITKEEHESIRSAIAEGRLPPQNTELGGEIYVHGGGTVGDWTRGCVALDNEDMTELFALVELGTPVMIVP